MLPEALPIVTRQFPHPETVFSGGFDVFVNERVPLLRKYGWMAHHPQFIFDKDNYAQVMFDMFKKIQKARHGEDSTSPWYPYVLEFNKLESEGCFYPEGQLGTMLKHDNVEEDKMRARRGDRAAAARLEARESEERELAAPPPQSRAQEPQATHCCADTREELGTLPPVRAQAKRGTAVPEGSLW